MMHCKCIRRWSELRSPWATKVGAALVSLFALTPLEAQAYIGPGAGITALGSLLALVAGLLFAVIGFVWYPFRRLRRRRKERQQQQAPKT